MATIKVENAEVYSVMKSGVGFRCQTQFKTRDGETVTEKWICWTKEKVNEGDVVTVEGLFSKKDESFVNDEGENIKYIAYHINNVTVTQQPKGQADEWLNSNATELDLEAPF